MGSSVRYHETLWDFFMNYSKIYDSLVERAKNRKIEGYVERHHIVPKCMGGSNEESNIVELTAREHYIAHKLLVEIYPNHKKLVYALWGMSNQLTSPNNEREYKISSREYERTRILFSENIKGRACTWGDKISKAKKGVSTGPQSESTKAKRRATMKANPFRHTEEVKKSISERMKSTKKTPEWRKAISETNKRKGIKPPYRGIPYEYGGTIYKSKKAASRILGIPYHRLK